MSRYAFLLALSMAWLAGDEHSALPAEAFAEQSQAAMEAGHLYQVDPLLLVAMAWEESRFDVGRISPAGACGPMQVKPMWVPWSCRELRTSIEGYRAGAATLTRWRMMCSEDPLACYNGGMEPGRRSRWYAARVRKTARMLMDRIETALALIARRRN